MHNDVVLCPLHRQSYELIGNKCGNYRAIVVAADLVVGHVVTIVVVVIFPVLLSSSSSSSTSSDLSIFYIGFPLVVMCIIFLFDFLSHHIKNVKHGLYCNDQLAYS